MCSHIGVYPAPGFQGVNDGNEMSQSAVLPQLRVIDAIEPHDLAIPLARSGGVTTVMILPGSANLMGGTGVVAKLKGSTVEEMIVPGGPRVLKMACGENPKRTHGGDPSGPTTRMGNIWMKRKAFEKARRLKQKQDAWLSSKKKQEEPMPNDLEFEPLVALLRGNASLNVHCYQVNDMEAMIRLSKEFGFKIAAFHHALEAYMIPKLLVENNISVATFSDLWGYKREAWYARVDAPAQLAEAGVKVALKSDHPVIDSRYLMFEAAKAHLEG